MSNPPVTASQSLLEQIESLSGIVYEMVDADHDMRLALSSAVADSFLDLSARAQQDGFRGLPELMRMLGDGLLRQINAGHVLDEADAITIAAWLPDVLAYASGQTVASDSARLIHGLAGLPYMPVTSDRVRELIANRLRFSAPNQSAPVAAPETSAEISEALPTMSETESFDKTAVHGAADSVDSEFNIADAHSTPMADQDFELGAEHATEQIFSNASEMGASEDGAVESLFNVIPGGATELGIDGVLGIESPLGANDTFIEEDLGGDSLGFDQAIATGDLAVLSSGEEALGVVEDSPNVVEESLGFAAETLGDVSFAESTDGSIEEDIANTDIWIAPEELAMATEAIEQRLLPAVTEIGDAKLSVADKQEKLREYEFQLGLLGNAMEILSLPQMKTALDRVSAFLMILSEAPEHLDDGVVGALMNWQVTMLSVLQEPGDATYQELYRDALQDPSLQSGVDDAEWGDIQAELNRIKIGMDPAYKATRKHVAESADIDLKLAPDVLPAVRDGMMRELPNNTQQLAESVRRLVKTGLAEDIDQARRVAHTLKGDANIVGVKGIANTAHALEDILVELAKNPGVPPRELGEALLQATDTVEAMSDHVLGRGPAPDDALDVLQGVMNWANALVLGEALPTTAPVKADTAPGAAQSTATATTAAADDADVTVPMLQIPVPLLDELLRLSSETIVLARQIEEKFKFIGSSHQQIAKQNGLAKNLVNELDEIVTLRGAALQSAQSSQGGEIDPLELDEYNELHMVSRRLIETNADVQEFSQAIDFSMTSMADLAATQDRIHNELQEAVLRTRMVPVKNVVPRLQRVVRQTARTLLKEVDLIVEGEDALVDSDMLDRLIEPMSHALRNAVDHGIESPEERAEAGKPAVGVIRLKVNRQAGVVHFELKDDGRGLNYARILEKARDNGLVAVDAHPTQDELARVILMPGFSTKEDVTQVSGRGIGMDVVQRRVQELKGTLQVHSTPGDGTALQFDLPAQLNAAHVALARSSEGQIAIVSSSVKQFLPVPVEAIAMDENGLYVEMGADKIPALSLDMVALDKPLVRPSESVVGAFVEDNFGRRSIVFTSAVDEMRNVIIKNFGPYVTAIPGVRGATILGSGGVAPVLDLAVLMTSLHEQRSGKPRVRVLEAHEIALPRCVVVDDSLSVRRALEQLMQDAGFEVRTAIDGIDALEVISQRIPEIVLVDLEMPRMNGLELTAFLRSNTQTKNVPIVMITSRSSEKHQQMAEQAGVTNILSKPYSDDELISLVRELTSANLSMRADAA